MSFLRVGAPEEPGDGIRFGLQKPQEGRFLLEVTGAAGPLTGGAAFGAALEEALGLGATLTEAAGAAVGASAVSALDGAAEGPGAGASTTAPESCGGAALAGGGPWRSEK